MHSMVNRFFLNENNQQQQKDLHTNRLNVLFSEKEYSEFQLHIKSISELHVSMTSDIF